MADSSVIGEDTRVTGRIAGDGNLDVLGHVEGEITLSGDVTVGGKGTVGANVSGRRITVRGAVRGDLVAEELLVLEEGARVQGDLQAPRISIAVGAFVRGQVTTGGSAERPARASGAKRPATPSVEQGKARPAVAARPAPAVATEKRPEARENGSRKAPPPPVVVALKKGAKRTMATRKAH
jgi:cytoskeletal protein CcmA (bactofilin family)